jgi:nucleoside-diphosphate-sugar epimerase
MTTLVTGAGLVGSLVAERLARAGERAVLFDVAFSVENVTEHVGDLDVEPVRGDITELSELMGAIATHGVRRIIHTASFLTSTVNARPVAGVRTNLMGTLTVLEAARLAGLERVVFCSANTVTMGKSWTDTSVAVSEDLPVHLVTEYPPTIYGTMKLACEWLSHNYADAYAVRTVSMRLGGVFGPWRGVPSGGPSRLAQHIIEHAWRGQPVRLTRADLEQRMDFVYARDVAKGLVLGADHPDPPSRVYNLSGGRLYSVREAVEVVGKVLDREVRLEEVAAAENRGSYPPGPAIDITLITKELGFVPDFPLDEAVRDYIAWLDRTAAGGGRP